MGQDHDLGLCHTRYQYLPEVLQEKDSMKAIGFSPRLARPEPGSPLLEYSLSRP